MKSIIFLMLLSFGLQTRAQNSDLKLVLTARKLSAVSYFKSGMPVRMVVKDVSEKKTIVKGYIIHVEKDKIITGSFNNKTY